MVKNRWQKHAGVYAVCNTRSLHTCSKYKNNQQIPLNVYGVFYSQNSHQHVSAGIPAIFKVMFLYKNTKLQIWLIVSPSLH